MSDRRDSVETGAEARTSPTSNSPGCISTKPSKLTGFESAGGALAPTAELLAMLGLPTVTLADINEYHDTQDADVPDFVPQTWIQLLPQPIYLRIKRERLLSTHYALPYESTIDTRIASTMIAITMYNENWDELERTIIGVFNNFKPWKKRYTERVLGQIILCIIIDGRTKVHPTTLEGLANSGFIQKEPLENAGNPSLLHCFYSRVIHAHAHHTYGPCQVLVCVKETNGGKLDSHKVFLDGLCARINPEYVMMLDVGTVPRKDALFKLFDAMEHDARIGGCAGEIEAERRWCNPVVVGQVFEYKIAHILDKSSESVLGFISVLPGAFSAYRYQALTEVDRATGKSPLQKYFQGLDGREMGPFMSNIFLAEDRILCFELLARQGSHYSLAYVRGAIAVTDVPLCTADLLKQRKRWLNGAIFALFYCFMHSHQFYTSGLPFIRKVLITIEMMVMLALTAVNLLGPGVFYAIFQIVVVAVLTERSYLVGIETGVGKQLANGLNWSFIFVLFVQITFGLGNAQPTHIKAFYSMTMLYFAVFQIIVLMFGFYFVFSSNDLLIWVSFAALFGLYPISAFIHKPWDAVIVVGALPFYLLLVPLFIIVLPIRAFANIHDISWGTKGLEDGSRLTQTDRYQRFRSIFLLVWLCANIIFAAVILQLHGSSVSNSDFFLRFMFFSSAGINMFRAICLVILRFSSCVCTTVPVTREYVEQDALQDHANREHALQSDSPMGHEDVDGDGGSDDGHGSVMIQEVI